MQKKPNAVDRAVERLGGIHQASLKTGIPYPTLQGYRRRGWITKYEALKIVAELSGIALDELAGPSRYDKTA